MKRILAFILCVTTCLCLAACGEKNDKKHSTIGVDVEYYAKLGQIPECTYFLGQDIDKMLKELDDKQNAEDSLEEDFYNHYEENGIILTHGVTYRYDPKKKSKGVNCIISSKDAFEFKVGDVSKEIKDSLLSYGFESKERDITEEESRYFVTDPASTCLEYEFDDKKVLFFFMENALVHTALLQK